LEGREIRDYRGKGDRVEGGNYGQFAEGSALTWRDE